MLKRAWTAKFGAAATLGLGDDVAHEAGAVLEALRAVFVVALVPHPGEERIALVEGAVVDLAGVEAGLPGAFGGRGPLIDLVLHLFLGHGPTGEEVGPGQLFLREGGGALDIADRGVAGKQAGGVPRPGVLELDGDRAPVLVHSFGEPLEAGDEAVVVEVKLHSLVAAVGEVMDVLDGEGVFRTARFHHQETHAALRQAFVVGDHALAHSLVGFHVGRAVGGLDDAVTGGDRTDLARLHQPLVTLRAIAHVSPPRGGRSAAHPQLFVR